MSFRTVLVFQIMLSAMAFRAVGQSVSTSPTPPPFFGVTVGYDVPPDTAVPLLRQLGVQTVRLWAAMDYARLDPKSIHGPDVFAQARAFKRAGFSVILLIQNPAPAPYATVKRFFDWAVAQRGPAPNDRPLKDSVDAWEILNELNLQEYWTGTAEQYVQGVQRAAWDVLSAQGEVVIGGSFTAWQQQGTGRAAWADTPERAAVARQYVEAGYLRYCHFAGVHPYTDTPQRMAAVLDAHSSIFQSKPLLLTEWNLKTRSDPASQASAMSEALPMVRQRAVTACFYRLTQTKGYWGLTTLAKGQMSPSEPFFTAYQGWAKAK